MYVYISSPYRNPDTNVMRENVYKSLDAATKLMKMGHTPYCPLLCHFWNVVDPKTDDEWMAYCKKWIDKCDALLRLEGYSSGSDEEVEYALNHGKSVYYKLNRVGHKTTMGIY
jgi:hypothetical protein